jgi:hypothetical protein
LRPRTRPELDDPVCVSQDIEVVLHDAHRMAVVDELVETSRTTSASGKSCIEIR